MRLARAGGALGLAVLILSILLPQAAEAQQPRGERQAAPVPERSPAASPLVATSDQAQLRASGAFLQLGSVEGESTDRRAARPFMQLGSVEGESRSERAKGGEIDVLSWSWGASSRAGGGGGGRVALEHVRSVTLTARDKSTPKLAEAVSRGQQLGTVVLEARPRGGAEDDYVRYTLHDVVVSSVRPSGRSGSDEVPTESISLNFSKVEVDYRSSTLKGMLGAPSAEGETHRHR